MSIRCTHGLLFVPLALAAALPAQSPAILGTKGNAEFLEALWRNNLIKEAEKVGQVAAASTLPEAEKAAVAESYRKLKIALAAKDGDALGRRDLVIEGLVKKTAELQAIDPKTRTDEAYNAVGEFVEQYRLLADALVEAGKQDTNPEKLADIRKDADERFTSALQVLDARKTAAAGIRKDDDQGSEVPLLVTFLAIGRMHYYHSLVHPADALLAKRKVELALTTLEEFDLEFSGTFAAYEAKLTVASCYVRQGNMNDALLACDDAIGLRTNYDKDAKTGIYKVDRDAADVISAAVLQKTLVLEEAKDSAGVIAACKDYFATIPSALDARSGKDILAAQAKAHIALGENAEATRIAQQLIDFGLPYAAKGQSLLAGLIDRGGEKVPLDKTLRIAEGLAGQGEYEQALRMCRDVQSRATGEDEKFAAQAMLITGAIYATRQWFHEAAVAFDAVVRRYPKSEQAPDALWRSIKCFEELEATDKTPMFKRMRDERERELVKDYPDHPRRAQLQLAEGERLERANKFLDAAKAFEAIGADSSVYFLARFRAASSYYKHSRSLASGGQDKESDQFAQKARQGFEAVLADAETKEGLTGPAKAQLDKVAFDSRIALANLLLAAKATPEEVEKVLAKVDLKEGDAQGPLLWALQIRVKVAKGDIEAAAQQMDAALSQNATDKNLLGTCRSVALALDNQAVERDKKKDHQAAQGIWRKAIAFYVKSAAAATAAEKAQIADRLRVIGMIDNKVSDKIESWFELPGFKVQAPDAWAGALQVYKGAVEGEGRVDHKILIGYARVLGFLGQWNDCEAQLSRLFSQEKIVGANKRIDSAILGKKPELLSAYLEWGFSLMRATSGDDKARRAKATDIFDRIVSSGVPDTSRHWWFARYGGIQSLFDRGMYEQADISMKSLVRTNPEFDEDRFGLKVSLKTLQASIAQKK